MFVRAAAIALALGCWSPFLLLLWSFLRPSQPDGADQRRRRRRRSEDDAVPDRVAAVPYTAVQA